MDVGIEIGRELREVIAAPEVGQREVGAVAEFAFIGVETFGSEIEGKVVIGKGIVGEGDGVASDIEISVQYRISESIVASVFAVESEVSGE